MVNPSDAETKILRENQGNTMAAAALAPGVTSSSATMILTIFNKHIHTFD